MSITSAKLTQTVHKESSLEADIDPPIATLKDDYFVSVTII